MFPPEGAAAEDVPLVQRIARWLDWWCTPRWRALLTWMGLAAAMGLTFDLIDLGSLLQIAVVRMVEACSLPIRGEVTGFVLIANRFVLFLWFEPFALRLNLPRGLAWLALRTGSLAASAVIWESEALDFMVASALPMVALIGWRSRSWIGLAGGALTVAWVYVLRQTNHISDSMVGFAVCEIPYAVVLLYGTRLLRAEERASRDSGRDRPPA